MAKKKTKPKKKAAEQVQRPKDFLDMIAPAAVKFNTDESDIIGLSQKDLIDQGRVWRFSLT